MVQGKELFQETTFLSSNAEKTAYSLSLHTASLFCQKDEASVLKYACTTLQHTVLSQLTQSLSMCPDLNLSDGLAPFGICFMHLVPCIYK